LAIPEPAGQSCDHLDRHGVWQWLFQFNPIYYLVDGFRWSATGRLETDPWLSAGVVGGMFVIVFTVAARLIATGYKLKP